MAEATVAPSQNTRFFCHECRVEVRPNIPDYTCSRCNSGFIEEMESRPAAASATPTDPASHFAELLSNAFLDPLSTAGPGAIWDRYNTQIRHRYNTRQAARITEENMEEDDDELRGVAPSGAVFHFNAGELQPNQQTFHGIINYVIQRLGSDLGGGQPFVHLHGNPGDYAWGTGGLDAIISQLFNQLEGSGAPPAQKEKIESLPIVTIEQSHVDAGLQCAICMDDFELSEKVRRLPCDHMYHSNCIVKWLEMHGTCPVCRKDLNGEDTSTNEDIDLGSVFGNGGGSGAGAQGASPSSSSSSLFSAASGSSSSSQNDH